MAKKEKEIETEADEVVAEVEAPKELSERDIRWEAFKERLKSQNPAKYEARSKSGELSKIPDSFK